MIRTRTRAACWIVAVIWGTSPLGAQSALSIDGSLLRSGVDTFNVLHGGQAVGRGVQSTVAITEHGSRAWLQTYAFRSNAGDVSTDTLLMDALTLRPLREARVSALGRFAFTFTPTEVVTWTFAAAGDSTAQRTDLAEGVFSSAALDAVVRALPLTEGMTAQVLFYYPLPATRGMVPMTIRVARSDTVSADDGGSQQAAWVVVAGEPGQRTIFWVDKMDRSIIQFDSEEGSAVIQFRR